MILNLLDQIDQVDQIDLMDHHHKDIQLDRVNKISCYKRKGMIVWMIIWKETVPIVKKQNLITL